MCKLGEEDLVLGQSGQGALEFVHVEHPQLARVQGIEDTLGMQDGVEPHVSALSPCKWCLDPSARRLMFSQDACVCACAYLIL